MPGQRSRIRYVCREGRRSRSHHWFTVRLAQHRRGRVRCTKCGSADVLYAEPIYQRAQAARLAQRCTCAGVPHPHRRASHLLCHHYPHPTWPLPVEQEQYLQDYSERLFADPRRTAHA